MKHFRTFSITLGCALFACSDGRVPRDADPASPPHSGGVHNSDASIVSRDQESRSASPDPSSAADAGEDTGAAWAPPANDDIDAGPREPSERPVGEDETTATEPTGTETMPDGPPSVPPTTAVGTTTLLGSTVSLGVHCCSAPPNDANLISLPVSAVVSDDIEFPYLRDSGTRLDTVVIPVNIDVGTNEIEVTYQAATVATQGEFNGYRLNFVPVGFRRISTAVLGRRTGGLPVPPVLTHTDTTLLINLGRGGIVNIGSRIHVVLTLE